MAANNSNSSKRWAKRLARWCITLVFMALVAEGLLRLFGRQAYTPVAFHVETTPSNPLEHDEVYGLVLKEGTFTYTLRDSFQFTAKHTSNKTRFVPQKEGNKLHVYGCSLAYGYGVSDKEVFSYLLNDNSEWAVQNFGTPAWGHPQMLLRLQEEVNKGNVPEQIVLAYAGFQDERGTMRRNWRKSLAPFNNATQLDTVWFPTIHNEEGTPVVERSKASYELWAWQDKSVLINALERTSNYLDDFFYNSHHTSLNTILYMAKWCELAGIHFTVMGMDNKTNTTSMLSFCQANGIDCFATNLDLMDQQWNLQPYDHHPNAAAHEAYAKSALEHLSASNQ